MSDLFRLATEISLAHANGMRLAHGLPPIGPVEREVLRRGAEEIIYANPPTLPVRPMQSKDDHDEICGMCGENVNDPHKPTCPACTAEGKTCEGGIGNWDGLD